MPYLATVKKLFVTISAREAWRQSNRTCARASPQTCAWAHVDVSALDSSAMSSLRDDAYDHEYQSSIVIEAIGKLQQNGVMLLYGQPGFHRSLQPTYGTGQPAESSPAAQLD